MSDTSQTVGLLCLDQSKTQPKFRQLPEGQAKDPLFVRSEIACRIRRESMSKILLDGHRDVIILLYYIISVLNTFFVYKGRPYYFLRFQNGGRKRDVCFNLA